MMALSGCGKSQETNAPAPESSALTNAQGEAYVDMTPTQAKAILKIEEVGTYHFPIEKEAVGSVSFDEDPAIVQAQSTLVSAAATFDSTGKELERVKALGETNGIASKEIEQATADHQTAEAALKTARDAVRALGISDAEIDDMVAAGKIPVFPGDGAHTKWVTANVIESESPIFHVGQSVEVRVSAYPGRAFKGKVSRIYVTVDPNTHRMEMRCEVSDEENQLRPGMLANLTIQVKEPVEATAIPMTGVVREDDGTMTAWVTTDRHRFTQRKLKLGLQKDGRYQVLEGLRPGELAVTDGAIFLSNLLNAPPSD